MRRAWWPVLAAGLLAVQTAAAGEPSLDPLQHVLRRAALELAAGRADAALAAFDDVLLPAPRDERAALAILLHAEAALLSGQQEVARHDLEILKAAESVSVRARAAAHELGLALWTSASGAGAAALEPDSQAAERARQALVDWSKVRGGLGGEERGLGDLAAAALVQRLGDQAARTRSLERVEDAPAEASALCLLGESALASGAGAEARERFEALSRTPQDVADGWLRGWGRAGIGRARAAAGDTTAARAALAAVDAPEPLVHYARLLRAQLEYAQHDLGAAQATLQEVRLRPWNPSLEAEARLLAIQVALDRDELALAESLGVALAADLPGLEREAASLPLSRGLVLDVRAWSEFQVRATLRELAKRDVLRKTPDPSRLASAADVVRVEAGAPSETRPDLVVLAPLLVHGLEPSAVTGERDAFCALAASRSLEARAASSLAVARERLAVREALLERGRTQLGATRAGIDSLAAACSRLHAGLAAHAARLAEVEAAWIDLLRQQLAALDASLGELERGVVRLVARYPEGRVVRARESTARARAGQAGETQWIVAADSVYSDVVSRYEKRVHDIFVRHEYAADAAKLDSLDAWVVRLRVRADGIASALANADAAERQAFAAAESSMAVAAAERVRAEGLVSAQHAAAESALAEAAHERGAAYSEAAAWASATARFHTALATPPGDTARLDRLREASASLEAFLAEHPQSPRADEALYRLGECALQRAALEYQADLAAFLARGGSAEDAPVPAEGYSEALDAYRRLLREHPDSPRARDAEYELGFVLAEMGGLDESSAHLEHFLASGDSLDLRHGRAALRLGDDRLLLDDRPAALAAFRKASGAQDPATRDLALFKLGWCAYDLDHHEESRTALHALLDHALADSTAGGSARARELAPEALELLALAFTADHDAGGAARRLDAWGRPPYDFALLQRMSELFASRAQYDEAIATDELLIARYPEHPSLPAVGEDLLRWIEVRHGTAAMHARAATLAPLFARDSEWARHASTAKDAATAWRPRWQSRLVEEDAAATRADSLAAALSKPEAAASRMAQRMRAAAAYEHRAAQRDSLHGQEGLRRAATLYERTLELFPGADDEATTWLWLGEARHELNEDLRAADAYAKAAEHPGADSSLVHTASIQELVALDAAAGRDPQALDRYAETTRDFGAAYPQDGHGVDAWSRVGKLAFDAKRWNRSSEAYLEVARRTPDPQRAAAALKLAGDVEWQRERFETAAERYDKALVAARTARSDSLAEVLGRLVPAAFYRDAEGKEKAGDRGGAASGFERVATAHPEFDLADRSLYRAAGLRAAAGDSSAAANDYARLVAQHPRSALVADAQLEYARCRESLGQREAAARAYRSFARQHPEHAQARPARLRAGLLFADTNQSAAADSEYATVLRQVDPAGGPRTDAPLAADLWVRRAHLAPTPGAAAPHWRRALACGEALGKTERSEAEFQLAEAARSDYQSIKLQQPITASLQRKQKAVEVLLGGYGRSAEASVEPWHAAACLRLGETLADFGRALRVSEPPPELSGEDLAAYQDTIAKQATALEDRAVEAWSRGLAAAGKAKHSDGWTKATQAKLWPMLAARVPTQPAPMFVLVEP